MSSTVYYYKEVDNGYEEFYSQVIEQLPVTLGMKVAFMDKDEEFVVAEIRYIADRRVYEVFMDKEEEN